MLLEISVVQRVINFTAKIDNSRKNNSFTIIIN